MNLVNTESAARRVAAIILRLADRSPRSVAVLGRSNVERTESATHLPNHRAQHPRRVATAPEPSAIRDVLPGVTLTNADATPFLPNEGARG